MDVLAVWLGKLTIVAMRLTGRRGTALPGLLVEKVFPKYLRRQLGRLPHGVIVVSGTNGKTTTTKMLATVLGEEHTVLTNATGGNFVRGTITATVSAASWSGRLAADIAVFELDEAHAVRFCAVHQPRRTLLLNVLRDQLDRFGEIDTTARLLATVAAATTDYVILNRDDPRLAAIAAQVSAEVRYFGVSADLRQLFPTDDELYADAVTVSDGVPATAELLTVELGRSTEVTLRVDELVASISLQAEGAHNAQNAAAAAAAALTTGMSPERIVAGLRAVQPAFGRGQAFDLDGRRVVLQLVKNPAGFRQSLRTVAGLEPAATVIAINDDYPDGRDMSWLWDVEFASTFAGRAGVVLTSGTRAADMTLRLQYDELPTEQVISDLTDAVRTAVRRVRPGETVAVFATYTAMWELHRSLDRLASVQSAGALS